MKFRTGLIIGGAAGYYFGAKAGRKRYLQMNRMMRQLLASEQVGEATDKVRAVIDLTKERAKDVYDHKMSHTDIIDLTDRANEPIHN